MHVVEEMRERRIWIGREIKEGLWWGLLEVWWWCMSSGWWWWLLVSSGEEGPIVNYQQQECGVLCKNKISTSWLGCLGFELSAGPWILSYRAKWWMRKVLQQRCEYARPIVVLGHLVVWRAFLVWLILPMTGKNILFRSMQPSLPNIVRGLSHFLVPRLCLVNLPCRHPIATFRTNSSKRRSLCIFVVL